MKLSSGGLDAVEQGFWKVCGSIAVTSACFLKQKVLRAFWLTIEGGFIKGFIYR